MLEDEVICLGTYNVPRVVIRPPSCKEIRVCYSISRFLRVEAQGLAYMQLVYY